MIATLDHVMDEIKKLSLEELFTLQRKLNDLVQAQVVLANSNLANSGRTGKLESGNSIEELSRKTLVVPPSYKRNPEDVKALLLAVFGLEQLKIMEGVDLTNLGVGSKTVMELISEDREDRL